MEKKRVLFPFLPLDYQAAEDWLNLQAREGWALKKLRFGFAMLERTETPPQYAVVLLAGKVETEVAFEQPRFLEYMGFVRKAGWVYVAQQNMLHIFSASQDIPPLESDPVAEAMRIRGFIKSRVLFMLLLLAFSSLFLLFTITREGGGIQPEALALNTALFMLLLVLGSISVLLIRLLQLALRFIQLRRAERNFTYPCARGIRVAKLRGILFLAVAAICILLLPAAIIADIVIDTANFLEVNPAFFVVILAVTQPLARLIKQPTWRLLIGLAMSLALALPLLFWTTRAQEMRYDEVVAVNPQTVPALVLHPVEELTQGRLQVQRSPLASYTVYEESALDDGFSFSYYMRCATKPLADLVFTGMDIRNQALRQVPPEEIPFAGVDRATWWTDGVTEALVLQKGSAVLRIWYKNLGVSYTDAAFQQKILEVFMAGGGTL